MHDHVTRSRFRATCRQWGRQILGVLLLIVLGGCATSPPLPGLLPGAHPPASTAPAAGASAQASTQTPAPELALRP